MGMARKTVRIDIIEWVLSNYSRLTGVEISKLLRQMTSLKGEVKER